MGLFGYVFGLNLSFFKMYVIWLSSYCCILEKTSRALRNGAYSETLRSNANEVYFGSFTRNDLLYLEVKISAVERIYITEEQ